VFVRDSKGRPVIGAPVRFNVAEGGGNLEGGGPVFITQTNGAGVAEASFTLGERTDAFPVFTYVAAGDQYATRIGVNLVDAVMATHRGDVAINRPFTSFGFPQAPTKLVRTNPDDTAGSISKWSDSIIAGAFDLYDNPVSNVDVTFSVLPFTSSCDPPPSGSARNAVVFPGINGVDESEPGNCPANPILGECGSPSITKKTSYRGAWGGVIAGSSAGATYRVSVSSVAGGFSTSYETGSCTVGPHLSYGTIGVINERGDNIQAAKVGEQVKIPSKISLYYSFPAITSTPVTTCNEDGCTTFCDTRLLPDITVRRTTGSVSFSAGNGGTTSGTTSEGSGTYSTLVTTGANPGVNPVNFQASSISRREMRASPPACIPEEEAAGDGTLNGQAFPVFGVLPTITELVSQAEYT
jgi:hypothetical protein